MRIFIKVFVLLIGLMGFVHDVFASMTYALPEKVSQGRAFLLKLEDDINFNGKVVWQKKEVFFNAENRGGKYQAEILLAMPNKASSLQLLSLSINGQLVLETVVGVEPANWKISELEVEPKYVEPPKEVLDRIERERKKRAPIMANISPEKLWELPFYRPVKTIVTSPYGARRVFNNVHKSPHTGVDFRGNTETIISSVADGLVVLAEDQYYSGNMVIIDHGQGVLSFYAHMSAMNVKVGDMVKRGQKIGNVGSTGRVTGPHLHLGLYAQGISFDALPLFEEELEVIGSPHYDLK